MNTEEMRKAIQNNPDADMDMLLEIQDVLDTELKKPYKKRDYELIAQLTEVIYKATSSEDIETVKARGIAELHKKYEAQNAVTYRKRWVRPAMVVAACLVVLIGANVWSVNALNKNIFQNVFHIKDDGIAIQFGTQKDREDEASVYVSEDDPYGMRTKCEEYGFSPWTPSYIPDRFVLYHISKDINSIWSGVDFYYRDDNDKERLVFLFKQFMDYEDFSETKFSFPSDKYCCWEEEINGHPVVISWEDQQFTAMFADEAHQIVYTFASIDIEYHEAMKILSSMFE